MPASTAPDRLHVPQHGHGASWASGRRSQRGRGTGLPPLLLLPAALAVAYLTLPLLALLVRAPWASVPDLLLSPGVG